jgi:hypothetical protein
MNNLLLILSVLFTTAEDHEKWNFKMTHEVIVLYINFLLAPILQKKGFDDSFMLFKPALKRFYSTIQGASYRGVAP